MVTNVIHKYHKRSLTTSYNVTCEIEIVDRHWKNMSGLERAEIQLACTIVVRLRLKARSGRSNRGDSHVT